MTGTLYLEVIGVFITLWLVVELNEFWMNFRDFFKMEEFFLIFMLFF